MFAARQDERAAFAELTARLVAEFSGSIPAASVARCVERSREALLASGLRRAGLLTATEYMARAYLGKRIPAHAEV